jgi:methionyl-tRNA formyltransferase
LQKLKNLLSLYGINMSYKIIFFGLTGLGSQMLQYLIEMGENIRGVITRKEKFEHPYYAARSIESIAAQNNISQSYDVRSFDYDDIDLILCCTFHKIIPEEILSKPKLGAFNFHPSLLPAYKGASPTKYCILNGELKTGITVHRLSNKIDGGEIVSQRSIKIENYFDDGLLRLNLASCQYYLLTDLLAYLDGEKVYKTNNNRIEASYYPPFKPLEINYTKGISVQKLSRKVRASSPFPGLTLTNRKKKYRIVRQIRLLKGQFESYFKKDGKQISIAGEDGHLIVSGYNL